MIEKFITYKERSWGLVGDISYRDVIFIQDFGPILEGQSFNILYIDYIAGTIKASCLISKNEKEVTVVPIKIVPDIASTMKIDENYKANDL